MVQQVSNLAQQNVVSPFQRGEQQQQQINQRQQQEQNTVTARSSETTQTRRGGTAAAQSQRSDTQTGGRGNQNELSLSQFREELGIGENERPPRGSIIDISA